MDTGAETVREESELSRWGEKKRERILLVKEETESESGCGKNETTEVTSSPTLRPHWCKNFILRGEETLGVKT